MTKVSARRIALLVTTVALIIVAAIYPWGLSIGEARQLASISKGLRDARSLTLFEGLPHPMFEREALKRELETKEIVRKGKEPFYAKPLMPTEEEITQLRGIVSTSGSYKSQGEIEKCGGFHADYCLSWKGESAAYDFLVCFGCEEIEVWSPFSTMRFGLRTSATELLRGILVKHRSQRPLGR